MNTMKSEEIKMKKSIKQYLYVVMPSLADSINKKKNNELNAKFN